MNPQLNCQAKKKADELFVFAGRFEMALLFSGASAGALGSDSKLQSTGRSKSTQFRFDRTTATPGSTAEAHRTPGPSIRLVGRGEISFGRTALTATDDNRRGKRSLG